MLTVLTGRSRRLWPRVVSEMGQARQSGAERLLLLTPDQYTLQAELELIDRLQLPGLLQMEVLSPSRLLLRIFALAGSPKRVRIDARGKAMVLADVLRGSRKELSIYGGAVERNGLVERVAGCIGDLKRAGMTPEAVASLADKFPEQDALRGKLLDIALLYGRYEERLEGAFLDGEDVQEALLERLPTSGFLSDTKVWIYGFDLISPQFLRQIAVMARHALSVRLAVTVDDITARDAMVFQPSRDTLMRLGRYFDAEGMQWTREIVDDPLDAPPELSHLERELFAIPIVPYEKEPEAITLSSYATPYEEAMRVAEKALALAREGMRFDQMAVVVGDVNVYTGPIESAFRRSEIPYHLVRQRRALSHPLLHGWLSALRCVTRGWRLEDGVAWLKCGFCGLARDEVHRLENYAIEHGLKGSKWRKVIDDGGMETLRRRFVEPLERLQKNLREASDLKALLAASYTLLEDIRAYDTLLAWQRELIGRGLLTEAADCAQCWRLLLETLDQLYTLPGKDKPSMASLAGTLEAGLSMAELGAVPAWPGMLQVGQLGHMKLGGMYRAVFLLGLQDGVLQAGQPGLLSDAEVLRAAEHTGQNAAFGLSGDELSQLKQVNLLDTLAAPTERLFISHALSSAVGEAQRPAMAVNLLQKVFPALSEQGGSMRQAQCFHAKGVALDSLGPMLQDAAKRGVELTAQALDAAVWLTRQPETRERAEQVLRILLEPPPHESLTKQMAGALYAKSRTSASRLETFAQCPFRHYVAYGLRPVQRREFTVARDETGTFYHRAMEGYALAVMQHAGWPDISREESDEIMEEVLRPLRAEWENKPLGDNAMLRAQGSTFCGVARRAAWNYTSQMRRGKFSMGAVEVRFGRGEMFPPIALTLRDGSLVWLEGRIDRVDFFADGDDRWLRVIDYKSGNTEIEPAKVYGGVQLQLLLYLMAALTAFPGALAAGAFYSQFRDPLIDIDSRDIDKIEQKIAKELSLSGIQLADVRVIRALDNADDFLNRDGSINKQKNTVTSEQMRALMRHAHGLAVSLAQRIAEGEITPRPAQLAKWRACAWCDYQSVCRFDAAVLGSMVRWLEPISKKELLERVCEADTQAAE